VFSRRLLRYGAVGLVSALLATAALIVGVYFTGLSMVPTPDLPTSDVPELASHTLWLAVGETPGEQVDPFWKDVQWSPTRSAAPHGAHAATEVARLWHFMHVPSQERMWQWHAEVSRPDG
jgi:hypothetical protein